MEKLELRSGGKPATTIPVKDEYVTFGAPGTLSHLSVADWPSYPGIDSRNGSFGIAPQISGR